MQQSGENFKNFAQKLAILLLDFSMSNIIKKDPKDSFIYILDQSRLVEQVLPQYFRHTNIQSFFRQFHLYGFKKIRKMEHHTFFHPKLKQGGRIQDLISSKKTKKIEMKQKKALRRQLVLKKRMENKIQKTQAQNQNKNIRYSQLYKSQENVDERNQQKLVQEHKTQKIQPYDSVYSEYDQNAIFWYWNYMNYAQINNMNIWM